MLFNGEAIFGVVDFAHGSKAVEQRARQMTDRAHNLSVRARVQTVGDATLGFVGGGDETAKESPLVAEYPGIYVVSCGELLDRRVPNIQYRFEPERSRFLASGMAPVGSEWLTRLDGTFCAAVWSENDQQLILTCDSRADCHLYYSFKDHQLAFSSWLPLLANKSHDIDRQAVSEFLRFLYIAAPRTIYSGIFRIEAGHFLIASQGKVETRQLAPDPSGKDSTIDSKESSQVLAKFEFLFEQAIRRRIDHRRAGVLLSSGVDSATLMAGCQKLNPGQVEAFTVGFDNLATDETNAARALATQIGVPHTELRFGIPEYCTAFQRVTGGFDQPFGDPAGLALVLACEAAKNKVDILCDGTGSDGLFGAPMPRHLRFSLAASAKLPESMRKEIAARLKQFGGRRLAPYASLFDFADPEELFITWSGWTRCELADLLGTPVSFDGSEFYRMFRASQRLGAQELYDQIGVLPPDDGRFEAAGLAMAPIELPYHDLDLWTFVRNAPRQFRMAHNKTKVLLRWLFARYFGMGTEAAKKKYFNIPLANILSNSNFVLVRQHLASENMHRHGFVDPKRAWPWIDRYLAGAEDLRFKVWALLMLHAWLDARN
jgi:asparagine synthase (glutamine-hydrolysing)